MILGELDAQKSIAIKTLIKVKNIKKQKFGNELNTKPQRNQHAKLSRRTFTALMAGLSIGLAPRLISANPNPKIVIIGAGIGGTVVARKLQDSLPSSKIVLVEPHRNHVTPFFTNQYLGGFKPLSYFTHNYSKLRRFENLTVIHDTATFIDSNKAEVRFKNAKPITYDTLVLSPGTSLTLSSVNGHSEETTELFPHAYSGTDSSQWELLRHKLINMPNGGLVAITAPRRPYRCTPAPYERASLVAAYLKLYKPKSKILILDSKNEFPLMDVVLELWSKFYGGLIEWVSADFGGAIHSVDKKTGSLISEDERYRPDVGNIIPPQVAGKIALNSGLTNNKGWCPIDGDTFESKLAKKIFILGDAIDAGDMPKSASATASQAIQVASSIERMYGVSSASYEALENACFFLTNHNSAVVTGGKYRVLNNQIVGITGYSTEVDEDQSVLMSNAKKSNVWYTNLVKKAFY